MGKASRKRRERMEQVQQAREIEGLVKRARLYDALCLQTDLPAQIKHILAGASVIDAQLVVTYLRRYGEVDILALPSVMPPTETTFIEFTEDNSRWGFCVNFDPAPDGYFMTIMPFLNQSRLMLLFQFNIDRDGVIIDETYRFEGNGVSEDLLSIRLIPLMTLALLNCRNIVTVDHEPDPADNAAYQRHFGVPMTTYKTLAIKPMGKQYERDDEQKQFDVMPLHIRRGNFAHYTDDAPLFGKYTGTFWRPATAVGDAKNGIRVKDYEVKP